MPQALYPPTSMVVDPLPAPLMVNDLSTVTVPVGLKVVAAKTMPEETYHRVSDFLATTVLREGEGILGFGVCSAKILE